MLVIGNKSQTSVVPRPAPDGAASTVDNTFAGQQPGSPCTHRIRVPDFHTGHLGFLPEKSVLVSGPSNPRHNGVPDERTCEVVVTPHPITNNILRVSCVFHERPGVVERIVNLMSHLNANIVTLESASLYQGDHHSVNLVLDMSQSWLSDKPLTGGERSKYIDVLPHLRISNRRGLELFLNIIWYCHEMLTWKDAGGPTRQAPEVYVSEFDPPEFTPFGTSAVKIQRIKPAGARGQTYFDLTHNKALRIATLLGMPVDKPFHYILLSDTESRSLRIQFFQEDHAARIFQIGFLHKDEVGAMATIAKVVAKSDFNVLSGLIRNVDEYHNVWEVILEFKGDRALVANASDPLQTIRSLLSNAGQKYRDRLAPYEVGVFIPSHAPIAKSLDKYRGFNKSIPLLDPAVGDPLQVPAPEPLIAKEEWPETQEWLLDYARLANSRRPRVFISCATTAGPLRDIVKSYLDPTEWHITSYDETTRMEATYTEARRLVADADYLIGIWTPDGMTFKTWVADGPFADSGSVASVADDKDSTNATGTEASDPATAKDTSDRISPWMHFELGQAVAFEREFKILAHDSLPPIDIVRRIAADRPVYWFKEQDEFKHVARKLVSFMNLNWRPKHGPGGSPKDDKDGSVTDPDTPPPPVHPSGGAAAPYPHHYPVGLPPGLSA